MGGIGKLYGNRLWRTKKLNTNPALRKVQKEPDLNGRPPEG